MAEATVQAGAPQKRRSRGLSQKGLAFWMVSPSMALIALVAAYPIIYAIWLSLHEYSVRVAGLERWAGPLGLRNYTTALQNSEFWSAMVTTLIFTVSSVFLELLIGLAMALAMHAAFKGQGILRTVVLVPWAILTVVTATMWRTIFESPQGFVNQILGTDTVWLGSEPQALIVIIIADVWKTAPFMALIFRTLDALRIFDLPYVLTKGSNGTTTLSLISQETFAANRIYGLGAAYSILTFITVMIVSFTYIWTVGGNIRGLAED